MSETICVVKKQGKTLRLVPEGDRQGNGDTIPGPLQRGLRSGQRVLVTRRPNGSIESIIPAPAATPSTAQTSTQAPSSGPAAPTSATGTRRNGARQRARDGYFANPYNFVPFSTAMREIPGLTEGPALNQDHAAEDTYSAKLVVSLKTVTPLLTMEQQGKDAQQPTLYSVRRDPLTQRPLIAGASVKGMLRSLYEQVTSSRLGIFTHTSPLSVRSVTADAIGLEMARVAAHTPGESITLTRQGGIEPRVTPPAPVNEIVTVHERHVQSLGTGTTVYAWLQLLEHNYAGNRYCWWLPVQVSSRPTRDAPDTPISAPSSRNTIVPNQPLIQVRATVHKTGRTIRGKHAERLFIDELISTNDARHENQDLTLTGLGYARTTAGWREKLESFSGDAPPGVAQAAYVQRPDRWKPLNVGQTLFLREHEGGRIELYPGMITRESFARSPAHLLGDELFPAARSTKLTAAERIFGWVPPERSGEPNSAHRGQLRVGAVSCLSEHAAPHAGTGSWQLATLNSPKPSHARFYTRDSQGDPTHGLPKRKGYRATDRLAGHKVYPHQERGPDYWRLPAGGWVSPANEGGNFPKDADGHFRNFLSAPKSAPAVSVAITDWVEPGVRFEFTIYLSNATRTELAALLWILSLSDDDLVLKLGMGKPLGFGSILVGIDWARSTIRSSEQLREHFGRLTSGPTVDPATARRWASAFDYVLRSKALAVYSAVIEAARGTELATHYPRLGTMAAEAGPQAETYRWFVENERPQARRHALPLLAPDGHGPAEVLPNDPTHARG